MVLRRTVKGSWTPDDLAVKKEERYGSVLDPFLFYDSRIVFVLCDVFVRYKKQLKHQMEMIKKFGDSLVMLDLSEKDNIILLIEEIRNQINAENENNMEFKPLDYKLKMILMIQIIKILEKLKERYDYLLYNYDEIDLDR